MRIRQDGMDCISLDEIRNAFRDKHGKRKGDKIHKEFLEWMNGQTMPLISKKEIKIPEPTEWVYTWDYFTFKDRVLKGVPYLWD